MSHVSADMDATPEPGADADLGTPAVDQAPDAETGWAAPDPAWPGADLELAEPTEAELYDAPEEPEAEL